MQPRTNMSTNGAQEVLKIQLTHIKSTSASSCLNIRMRAVSTDRTFDLINARQPRQQKKSGLQHIEARVSMYFAYGVRLSNCLRAML